MGLLRTAKTLGFVLLFLGAAVTVAHPYQHCIADAASLFTGCQVCQAIAGSSVNPAPTIDPVVILFRRQPEKVVVNVVEAEILNSDSRGPPQL